MPSRHSSDIRQNKPGQSDNLRRKPPSNDRDNASSTSESKLSRQFGETLNGKDAGQSTFDHHVSLLSDGRMSQPMYSRQRQEIFRQIQSTHGNRYAQRLADAITRKHDVDIQTKLTVGPAGDQYEQEADKVASQVVSQMSSSSPTTQIQADEQSDEDLQLKPVGPQIGLDGGDVDSYTEQAIESSRGGGTPLPKGIRSSMEGVFGADFSGVKVHTDSESHALNRDMQARAFTSGQDIYFSKNAYKPNSPEGKETLAHELTHVVQQNGIEPMFDLIAAHPADRDEREADDVAQLVGKYGDLTAATIERMPDDEKIHRLMDAKSDIQRASGKKVAWAVTKGIFFGIINALAGPLRYLAPWERKELKSSWAASGDEFNYPSIHLQNISKTVTVLQEIGALAAWITLLTGAGSIIAAAFAPAGLAVSAILGTIATISTLVGASIGVITAVLAGILARFNYKRAQEMPQKSLARKEIMLVYYRDLAGSLAGIVAAIGGAIGFGAIGGGSVVQSGQAIGQAGLGAHAAAMGTSMGSDQAFAIGSETQDQLISVVSEQKKANLEEDPRYREWELGKGAQQQKGKMGNLDASAEDEKHRTEANVVNENVGGELGEAFKKRKQVNLLRIQRQPADGDGGDEDYGSQLMQEMNKAERAVSSTQSDAAQDKQLIGQEKKELSQSSSDNSKSKKELGNMAGLDSVGSNLDKIGSESESGLSKAEAKDEEKATEKEPDKAADVKSKEESLLQANKSIDDIEAQSGEKFGGKKPGVLGKITGMFMKGARSVRNFFLSGLIYLKDRIKGMFTAIRDKVAAIILRFSNLQEPVEGLQEELDAAQGMAPQAETGLDEALSAITGSSTQSDNASEKVEEVKDAIKG